VTTDPNETHRARALRAERDIKQALQTGNAAPLLQRAAEHLARAEKALASESHGRQTAYAATASAYLALAAALPTPSGPDVA
jgi:hypothetical protein